LIHELASPAAKKLTRIFAILCRTEGEAAAAPNMSAARRWASGPTGGALAGGQRAVEDEWNEFVADLAPSGELAGEEEPVDRQGERHLRSEISLD
jgi:hypothetical protein